MSGSSSTSGMPGSAPSTRPPITSRMGYGTRTNREAALSATTAAINPSRSTSFTHR